VTTTQLSNPTFVIGATDLSDQCTSVTLTTGFDELEITAFGATGRRFTKGLQAVEVSATLFLSYGASEVEAVLVSHLGFGTSTLVIGAAPGAESESNPIYTITNAMLASFTPINGTVGELQTVEVTFTGGTFARDITP
jgi:hypothetical protein